MKKKNQNKKRPCTKKKKARSKRTLPGMFNSVALQTVEITSMEQWNKIQEARAKEEQGALDSKSSFYLTGRVKPRTGALSLGEIKEMVDATFEGAVQGCQDAWYPNQFAMAMAFAPLQGVICEVRYFLSKFEYGLELSRKRAESHEGLEISNEASHLDARCQEPGYLSDLTFEDWKALQEYVANHPKLRAAVRWYESNSNQQHPLSR